MREIKSMPNNFFYSLFFYSFILIKPASYVFIFLLTQNLEY